MLKDSKTSNRLPNHGRLTGHGSHVSDWLGSHAMLCDMGASGAFIIGLNLVSVLLLFCLSCEASVK